jgi:hypothetical protein
MARPTVCGRCGEDLTGVPGQNEHEDRDGRDIVGQLACPACGAAYVYQRSREPRDRQKPEAESPKPERHGDTMQLFSIAKVGLFLDAITHGTETRNGDEVKIVTLTLRAPRMSPQLASAMPGPVRMTLFKSSDAAAPRAHMKRVEFTLGVPRQELEVYASPDTTDPTINFDQAKIIATVARVDKDDSGWTLVVKCSFGPVDKTELEYIEAWRLSQRWVTFYAAEAGLFDEDDGEAPAASADEGDESLPLTH